ncbi:hypothetical protein AWZ03_013481 [Drosophila navojoa]|uniref:Fucosyltransferase n=1 Tax=Drosophila navojoa TaxID=7232 RepID=A0A484ATT2_DRONA|nr:alpha-(1,3)-fucosyltransferase C [Drosophila navojoa]TDG40097.1 hypothetical protein AWZ03_013481 [Drosophila navojoa]
MRLQMRRTLTLVLLCLFLFGALIYKINHSPLVNQNGILREYLIGGQVGVARRPATRTILLWSSFFGNRRWNLPYDTLGPQQFREDLGCPVYQCELSNRHEFLPSLELYDAIVYHVAQPFPLLLPLPARRSPHQAYVFALMEPPGETKHQLSDERHFYNLTMTYRLDSDIVWPYAHVVDTLTGARVAPATFAHWRAPPPLGSWNDSTVASLWHTKTKMAAWFVSHCQTLSEREQLAAALQKHIQVDIYGKCGTLNCARDDPHCSEMLDTDYMFYLAFENSLCTDYVTEKLYDALQRHIVPVVFGGANYSRFLPPHSYIDANRFDSAEELAQHMRFVAGDKQEYISYFWWREHYHLATFSPFCELCARLHQPSWMHRTQSYDNIESWWFNGCRLSSHIRL